MARFVILTAAAALFTACASSQPQPREAPPPAADMNLEEAHKIVAALEKEHAQMSANDPLHFPNSLDDVFSILKRDQIDLFEGGIKYASQEQGLEFKALHGQIELAWGEAQIILAEILWGVARRQTKALRRLEVKESSGDLDAAEKEQAAAIRASVKQITRTAQALMRLAQEHVANGAKIARDVIEKHPDDYLGYRLAADYYRMREDWTAFGEMVEKIKATNPDSNGLVFLQGIAAIQRDEDTSTGADAFNKALETDPEFTRAQAHLVLIQSSLGDRFGEYEKLKALNPKHQIVVWAGQALQREYDAWMARRRGRTRGGIRGI